jgi:hypothetical protein
MFNFRRQLQHFIHNYLLKRCINHSFYKSATVASGKKNDLFFDRDSNAKQEQILSMLRVAVNLPPLIQPYHMRRHLLNNRDYQG